MTQLPPTLSVITIGIVLAVLLTLLFLHMRKRSNRDSMANTPERGEPGAPDKPRGEPL